MRNPFWAAGETVYGYWAISKLPYLSALIAWRRVVVNGDPAVTWVTSRRLKQLGADDPLTYTTTRCEHYNDVLRRLPEGALRRHFPACDMSHTIYACFAHYTGWHKLSMDWSPILPTEGYAFHMLGTLNPAGTTTLGFVWNDRERVWGWVNNRQRFFVGTSPQEVTHLEDVNWAWWRSDGRLLTTTTQGDLQLREVAGATTSVIWETNIRVDDPDPQPAPEWATRLALAGKQCMCEKP